MEVYLLRHGIAEDGAPGTNDADRALTPEGRRKLEQVLKAAAERGTAPDLILTSPLLRAVQTAEIAKKVLQYPDNLALSHALTPWADPRDAWEEIRAHKGADSLLLVGHNPLFSQLAAYLAGESNAIEFKKGSLMRLDFETFTQRPQGTLRWHLTSKTLKGK